MCGIFGYIGEKKNGAERVITGLKNLEYRGYDSWGIAVLTFDKGEKKIILKKKIGSIGKVSLKNFPDSNFVFGHTRWATHGGVTETNAHPHLDCTGKFALIHNGIVENYDVLQKELKELKHRFVSETDTEVIVHLIEENYKNLLKNTFLSPQNASEIIVEAVRLSFNRLVGLNAIIIMHADLEVFVAAKNGSPLVIGLGKGENYLASDAHALLSYTRKVYFMNDQELVLISKSGISVINSNNGKKISPNIDYLDWNFNRVEKGKFRHFMLKEIYEQPSVIENIVDQADYQVEIFAKLIKRSYGTYLVGCGTAAYACLAGTYIFSKIANRHINFNVGSEFGYLIDFLTEKSLVIALSQSGETIDVVEAVKKAKEKKATIAALVNVLGSSLYRIADNKLLLNAGIEQAVVSTKAFTAKLAILILLAYCLVGKKNEGKKLLKNSVIALKKILNKTNILLIKKLVKKLLKKEHIYIIGRGVSYSIALETALKIKEASYKHAEGFAAGELKHGVIALVEKGTPCMAFLPNDDTYGATLAGAMEMKARGGFIIGISYKPHEVFDYYLPVMDCGIASIIPSIVVGQLLGYYLAIQQGINPDKPRNLAKSVTVK